MAPLLTKSDLRRIAARSRLQLRVRDVVLSVGVNSRLVAREDLARRYIRGSGLEIGALTEPQRVPPGVEVRYVDYLSREELIRVAGDDLRAVSLDPESIVPVHIVDDAATLASVPDASADFLIANHVVEHIEDPTGALENFLRVIRPGGTILLTLPDARFTFDARRQRTSPEHLRRDHADGPAVSRESHYAEWARFIEGVPEDGVAARVAQFSESDARHHFHVWELEDFLAFLRATALDYELVHASAGHEEFAVVLRRPVSAA